MCLPNKHGRPSSLCLIPLALLTMILGGGLVGVWVGCYYECVRGMLVEYNYYAAIWTGGLAVFSGLLQCFLVCFWNKPLKYFLVFLNIILLLCCLLCGALYSYVTYLEVGDTDPAILPPTVGMILSGLQAVLAVFIMFFVMMWNCVIACSNLDDQPEDYEDDHRRGTKRRTRRTSRPVGVRGPYEDDFFNREPAIYQTDTQEHQRPQEVSYGQPASTSGTAGRPASGSTYIIPRASVRGAVKDDGYQNNGYQNNDYHSNGGTMVVDGRENFNRYGGEEQRGFYSGSSRYQNGVPRQNGAAFQSGVAHQNGTGGRGHDHGANAGNRYNQGISLMQMHGVAPAHNMSEGYY